MSDFLRRNGATRAFADRFWSRLNTTGACWLWTGTILKSGYGQIALNPGTRRQVRFRTHRLAWMLTHGDIPTGQVICHSCDTPRCCRPSHLFLGTQRDNILDSIHKGRYNVFGKQKLNAAQVREIRALAARGVLHREIAARFGLRRHSVTSIVNRKSWRHI